MIEAEMRLRAVPPRPSPVAVPGAAAAAGVAADGVVESTKNLVPEARGGEDRSVNLRRRFFNAKTGLSFLIGLAILVSLFRVTSIHPKEILAQLRTIDVRLYALAIIIYATTFLFRGLRWQRLLGNTGSKLPLAPLTEVIFLSWFVNSIVPAKLGDLYRGYLLRREYGQSMSRTVGTVVAERVLDILALILLLGATGYFVLKTRASGDVDNLLHVGWVLFAVLVMGMLVVYRYGERLVRFFPHRIQDVYAKFAHGAFASLHPAPLVLVLTVLAWGAEAGRLFFVMKALHVGVGPGAALFTVAAISLALIAPTPGGLGAVEAAFVAILAVFGVPVQVALAVALMDRLISYYSLIAIGLPTFLLSKRGR
jgi:hypothetical protein